MHYVRFLKPPKIVEGPAKHGSILALITVVSDLGERFFEPRRGRAPVTARLMGSAGGNVTLHCKEFTWATGMRSLQLRLELQREHLSHAVSLHVAVGDVIGVRDVDDLVSGLLQGGMSVVSAWSAPLQPHQPAEAAKLVQRRLSLACAGTLVLWEETGDSIACHTW